jgi:hypothetical protein
LVSKRKFSSGAGRPNPIRALNSNSQLWCKVWSIFITMLTRVKFVLKGLILLKMLYVVYCGCVLVSRVCQAPVRMPTQIIVNFFLKQVSEIFFTRKPWLVIKFPHVEDGQPSNT